MTHGFNARPRVLALAIETASPCFIDAGCREGIFPVLQSLRARGIWGTLHSVTNISSGSVWPSMYTGCNPAKHGMANFHMHLVKGTYHIDRYGPDQVKRAPFWDYLGQQGLRSVIVDVPLTRPRPNHEGVLISAWGVEGPAWIRESHPPDLLRRILKDIGPYALPNDDYRRSIRPSTREQYRELRGLLLAGIRQKTQLLRYLMKQEQWNLFLAVYSESHWAVHVMYQTLDPRHPDHRPELADEFQRFYRELFQAQDEAIGELLEHAPDEISVLVFSASGFRPNYTANHLLPEVLNRLGVGSAPSTSIAEDEDAHSYSYYRIRRIQDTVSTPLIMAAKRVVPRRIWEKWTRRLLFARENWARSKAFCLPNDYCGSVRINLRGREPNGLVSPEEYDGLCDELERAFLQLKNAATGAPAVEEVLRVRRECSGEHVDALPDLSIVWSDAHPFEGIQSDQIGVVRGVNPERRPGAHHAEGFYALAGPTIEHRAGPETAHLVDLAPTVIDLLGAKAPDGLDGSIIRACEAGVQRVPPAGL
ncbi:MAG: alkaline phosphatase family protein [Candidatus Hydrogenedentes bacterium]|nr:alkaline phosphatase family protein [Candidatus Hydrogenedentota bacterium]